jgi:hypothetical protein
MADHRARECGPGLGRNFDGAGDKELVVGHEEGNVQRPTCNVQRRMQRLLGTQAALATVLS